MYATEYTWISDPTKVISSTNVRESGSSCRPASTWKLPAGTQLNRWRLRTRSSASWPSSEKNTSAPSTKDAHDRATASQWPQRSVRRPPSSSAKAPRSGIATSSQAPDSSDPLASATPWGTLDSARAAVRVRGFTRAVPSVLQQVRVVDRR